MRLRLVRSAALGPHRPGLNGREDLPLPFSNLSSQSFYNIDSRHLSLFLILSHSLGSRTRIPDPPLPVGAVWEGANSARTGGGTPLLKELSL